MTQEYTGVILDEVRLTLDEFATSCSVSREWIIEHVEAGVLPTGPGPDPGRWSFSSHDMLRARRLLAFERDFDANVELAGLVADLLEELERLRTRLRRAGVSPQ